MEPSAHAQSGTRKVVAPVKGLIVRVALVAACTMCIAVTYAFGIYLFATIAPDIRAEIALGYDAIGLLTAAGMGGFLVFSLICGWLRDRIGADWLTIVTLVVCTACLGLQALAVDVWALGVLRFVLGACTATIWAPMVEIVPRFIAPRHQGRVLGLISSGTNFGLMLNGALTYWILADGTWRDLFIATAIIAAGLSLIWALAVRRTHAFANDGLTSDRVLGVAHAERGSKELHVKIGSVMAVAGLGAFVGMPATSFLSSFTVNDLGLPDWSSAAAWSVMGMVGAVSGAGLGAVSDRFGYRAAFGAALALLVITASMFAFGPVFIATPFIIAIGLGAGFFPIYGLIPSYIAKVAPPEIATRTFGFVNVALGVFGMFGNAASGLLRDATGDHTLFFGALGTVALVACISTRWLPEPSDQAKA